MFLATIWSGVSPSIGRGQMGCVEALLKPPGEGALGTYVENPGRRPGGGGSGGQLIDVHLKYGEVAGCDSYQRTAKVRLELKRHGGPWETPPPLRDWSSITTGLEPEGSRGEFEGGEEFPAEPSLLATCEEGHRPRFRIAVKTAVKIVATGRTAGTAPIDHRPVAYRPAGAAHC